MVLVFWAASPLIPDLFSLSEDEDGFLRERDEPFDFYLNEVKLLKKNNTS